MFIPYCIIVVLVPCSALRDSYRNKRMKVRMEYVEDTRKAQEKQKEKINSNESDGWQMQEACKGRN